MTDRSSNRFLGKTGEVPESAAEPSDLRSLLNELDDVAKTVRDCVRETPEGVGANLEEDTSERARSDQASIARLVNWVSQLRLGDKSD